MSTTASMPARRDPRRLTLAAVALTTGALLVLAGCGSSSSGTTAPQGAPASQQGQNGGGFGGAGGNFVTGLIAAVSGKTLQVQGTDSQTAVSYTAKTRFSEQTKVAVSAVKVGSCVMVQSSDSASGTTTTVTATNVSVSSAVKGACTGRGGFGGGRGAGRPGGVPSGGPSGMPSGAPSGGPQGNASGGPQGSRTPGANGVGRGVFGKVASVSGSGFTVTSASFGTTKSETYTVTSTAKTTYTEEKVVKASAAKVGTCATAAGKTDGTGAVTASTISLRPAVNGTCTFGLRRPSGRPSNG